MQQPIFLYQHWCCVECFCWHVDMDCCIECHLKSFWNFLGSSPKTWVLKWRNSHIEKGKCEREWDFLQWHLLVIDTKHITMSHLVNVYSHTIVGTRGKRQQVLRSNNKQELKCNKRQQETTRDKEKKTKIAKCCTLRVRL